jgi:hypothetical protein
MLWDRSFRGWLLLQPEHLIVLWKRQQVCLLRRHPSYGEDVQTTSRYRHQLHTARIYVKLITSGYDSLVVHDVCIS